MKTLRNLIIVFVFPFMVFGNTESEKNNKTPYHEYHNRISVFSPNHLLYERIKPNAIYTGVDLWVTWAGTTLKNYKTTFNHYLVEVEFRMGYSFFLNGCDYIRPILGLGLLKSDADFEETWFDDQNGKFTKHKFGIPDVAYVTGGFMYDHEFNSIFNLGFNLKGMIGASSSNEYVNWNSVLVGFDASLPITFRFGHKRHWDLKLEPFNIFLIGGDKDWINTFGGRGTIGYRF